jgi:hypothetical protein
MGQASTERAHMEHRCGTRVPLSARAILTTRSQRAAVAWVTDASVTGAFVETSLKPVLLSRVVLRLPSGFRDAIMLEACVVRHEDRGIALEWLDPGSEQTIALLLLADGVRAIRPAPAPPLPGLRQEPGVQLSA